MNFNQENFSEQSNNKTGTTTNVEVTPFGKGLIIFICVWIFIGLVAFILSLVCFARSGSTFEKIIGLLLAIFFGPFYFLFYVFNKGYCR